MLPAPRLGRIVAFALAAAFGTRELSAETGAAPEVVRASVELAPPVECGSGADLIARITRRSDRIRIDPVASRRVRVSIVVEAEVFVATLELEQPSGRRSARTLRASSCDEALEATALVAAVSLDPAASTAPERELPPPVAPPVASNPVAVTVAPRGESVPATPAEKRGFYGAMVALAQAAWGPAPSVLPGFGLAVTLGMDRESVLAPALRLGYAHHGGGGFTADSGVGEASFQLDEGTLELCPLRLGSRRAGAFPCPFVAGGRLLASGSEALEAESHARPWWVFGGSLLGSFEVAGPLVLQAQVRVGIPLIKDTFQFDPNDPAHVVHEVPGAVVDAGFGAGLAFP